MSAECVGRITKSGSLIPISVLKRIFSCQLVETIELIWGKLMDLFQFSAALTGFGLSVVPGIFFLFQNILILFLWFPGSQTHVHVVVCYISPVLTMRKNLLGLIEEDRVL